MTWSDLRRHWRADLYRYYGRVRPKTVLKLLCTDPGALFMVHWRLAKFLHEARPTWLWLLPRLWQTVVLNHYKVKFGIGLPVQAEVGRGFRVGHYGCIFVNSAARIGDNCLICQEVTLGKLSRGKRAGAPTIGNNVYLSPGAKVLGKVRVGDHAVVAANSVVTDDVPDYGVVGGVPAKLISMAGSEGYATHTDYPW